jgi:hypothetical protein
MQLARVADTIGIQGSPLDPHERIGALIEMQDIDRNDLPGDLQALYDEIETYLGEATG